MDVTFVIEVFQTGIRFISMQPKEQKSYKNSSQDNS